MQRRRRSNNVAPSAKTGRRHPRTGIFRRLESIRGPEVAVSSHNSKSAEMSRASTSTSSGDTSESGPININIQGQKLSIRSDRDAGFVRQLANYIDHTLEELQSAAPSAPMDKLLMLASMTVAEELFETRHELQQVRRKLEESTETMFDLIDQVEEI